MEEKELPKLDDEFAKEASEFDTLKELKASIKEKLEKENEETVVKAVTENIKVEVPSGMVETEVENMIKDIETRLSYQGIKLEQYLQMLGKTAEEMKKEYEPQAEEAVKTRLMLEAVIKAEKIEETSKTIKEGIVISQETDANTTANAGDTVKIHVSIGTGVNQVVMPNVLGKTEADAKSALEAKNLVVKVEYKENTDKEHRGRCIYNKGRIIHTRKSL